jgi:uncharacterized protein
MIGDAAARPVPMPTAEALPFWEAARRHELCLPRCSHCLTWFYPPPPRCPRCLREHLTWTRLSGRACLNSWTTVHADLLPGVPPPFVIAEGELAEQPGLILVAHLVGTPASQLQAGMALQISFADAGRVAFPQYRPAELALPARAV